MSNQDAFEEYILNQAATVGKKGQFEEKEELWVPEFPKAEGICLGE